MPTHKAVTNVNHAIQASERRWEPRTYPTILSMFWLLSHITLDYDMKI